MIVIHGDNLVASRNRLVELIDQAKSQSQEIVQLNGDKITSTELLQALESQSLFGTDRLVVIERLFSRVKSKRKRSAYFHYFSKGYSFKEYPFSLGT